MSDSLIISAGILVLGFVVERAMERALKRSRDTDRALEREVRREMHGMVPARAATPYLEAEFALCHLAWVTRTRGEAFWAWMLDG